MAQTMTRPAQDDPQNVGNLQEVERTASTFGTFGRYTEIPLDQMTPEQRTGYDFEVKERGEVPGPHKIWLQNPKLLEIMIPVGRDLHHAANQHQSGWLPQPPGEGRRNAYVDGRRFGACPAVRTENAGRQSDRHSAMRRPDFALLWRQLDARK